MFDYHLNEFASAIDATAAAAAVDGLNDDELQFVMMKMMRLADAVDGLYDLTILKASMVLDSWSKWPEGLTIDQMT